MATLSARNSAWGVKHAACSLVRRRKSCSTLMGRICQPRSLSGRARALTHQQADRKPIGLQYRLGAPEFIQIEMNCHYLGGKSIARRRRRPSSEEDALLLRQSFVKTKWRQIIGKYIRSRVCAVCMLEKGADADAACPRSPLNSTTAHARTHSLTHFLEGADAGFAARAANFPLPAKVAPQPARHFLSKAPISRAGIWSIYPCSFEIRVNSLIWQKRRVYGRPCWN